jgi:hypothetical protein
LQCDRTQGLGEARINDNLDALSGSDGTEGTLAYLSERDLRSAPFPNDTILSRADLRQAKLREAEAGQGGPLGRRLARGGQS